MKICFFDFTINFGGASQGSLYLLYRLKKRGYSVAVVDAYGISEKYKIRAQEYELDYYVLNPNSTNYTIGFKNKPILRFYNILKQSIDMVKILKSLFLVIKNKKPNIFIVNNSKSLFFLRLLKPFFKFKIIFYFRIEGSPDQLNKKVINMMLKYCDHVITHSKNAVKNLKKYDFPDNYLTYVPNCIESHNTENLIPSVDLPVRDKFRIILAAARPVREKGHHIAIEAIHQLKKMNIHVDLLIPGVIPVGIDKTYYNYLISLIEKYQLQNNIHFIGWRNNLIADIVQCDAVVLPSHTEGFPRSIIESMMHKVPVCATPVGGIPEAIFHEKTGILFDIDDVNGLVNGLLKLINDENFRLSITANAYKFSLDYFNADKNTDGIISILDEI